MAITRLTAPSITGLTIPNTSINNASLDSVTALPSGVGGKVLQMKSVNSSTNQSFSSETFATLDSMSITFSPLSSSSIILFQHSFSLNWDHSTSNQGWKLKLRDNTNGANEFITTVGRFVDSGSGGADEYAYTHPTITHRKASWGAGTSRQYILQGANISGANLMRWNRQVVFSTSGVATFVITEYLE